MLSIKDYLNLRDIYCFLSEKQHEMLNGNNGYTCESIESIRLYCCNLEKILKKLESE